MQAKIGNTGLPQTITAGCRLACQYEAVKAWHAKHPAAFWCANMFEPEPNGKVFTCGFAHRYFDLAGKFQSVWVAHDGQIT